MLFLLFIIVIYTIKSRDWKYNTYLYILNVKVIIFFYDYFLNDFIYKIIKYKQSINMLFWMDLIISVLLRDYMM